MKPVHYFFIIGLLFLLFGCLSEEEQAKAKIDEAITNESIQTIMDVINNYSRNDSIKKYGEEGILQVIDNSDYGSYTDSRDGQKYKTIIMRDRRTWLAENVRYFDAEMKGGLWCPDKNKKYCEEYGRLYNWSNAKKACPKDWHLPTDDEWWNLTQQYGNARQGSKLPQQKSIYSSYEKITEAYWALKDKTKFNVQLSGRRHLQLHFFSEDEIGFDDIGTKGYYWTSSEIPGRIIIYEFDGTRRSKITRESIPFSKDKDGLSCRCIKNK